MDSSSPRSSPDGPTSSPKARDWRFANRAWRDNPGFRRLAQTYLAWERTVEQVIADAELDWRTEERARFADKAPHHRPVAH